MARRTLRPLIPGDAEQRRQLAILAGALVLSMSTWFSTAAVLGRLRIDWELSRSAGAWLTIMVQLGFVAGAVVSSVTNLADRSPPRRLLLLGTMGAAVANVGVVVGNAYGPALVARFVTGVFPGRRVLTLAEGHVELVSGG